MARIHFIVNPLRQSIGLRWPYEEQKIESLTKDFKVHIIRGRLHAEILARQAMEEGAELIVSVGGDSTFSEIANGIYRASLGGQRVPKVTLYPELHAGDTVKSLQLRKSFLDFLNDFLKGEAINDSMDIGEIEFTGDYGQRIRRVFVNCAGFGFSAVLVDRLSQDYRTKRNQWNFLKLLARLVPFYKHPVVDVRMDGRDFLKSQPTLTGLIHNGRYAAYGLDLSASSSLFDGKLEVSIIRKTFGYRYLLGIFPLFAGLLHKASFVSKSSCREIEVSSSISGRRVRVDFDGDTWGYLPLRIRVLERSLALLR